MKGQPWMGMVAAALFLWGVRTAYHARTTEAAPPDKAAAHRTLALGLPLFFEDCGDGSRGTARFVNRGRGYTLSIEPGETVIRLRAPERAPGAGRPSAPRPGTLRASLVGGRRDAPVEGLDLLPGRANYYHGRNPAQWRTGVPLYGRVRCREVYPGVDLVYHGREGRLEYDFMVAPGADPRQIRMAFRGADRATVDSLGDLILATGAGDLRQYRPVAYQEIDGRRRAVAASFSLEDGRPATEVRVALALGGFDRSRPLIIDPVLSYSTCFGGSNYDYGAGIAVDGAGAMFLSGVTFSNNLPSTAVRSSTRSDSDGFLAKMSASGSLLFVSYFGGTGNEVHLNTICDVAVDAAGSAYLCGQTHSGDFPTTPGALKRQLGNVAVIDGHGLIGDAFVIKVNTSGQVVYSTLLGGDQQEQHDSFLGRIAVDGSGNACICGVTEGGFPVTANAARSTFAGPVGGGQDAFFAKLNSTGSALLYATYLGGTRNDLATAIVLDGAGVAYLAGRTISTDFPRTANSLPLTLSGSWDAWMAKIDPSKSGPASLLYSTYLGGSGYDEARGVGQFGGSIYVAGVTNSTNFPITNGYRSTMSGSYDGFLAVLAPDGRSLTYSTYIGGGDYDEVNALAVDRVGSAYVCGYTNSTDLITRNAVNSTGAPGGGDAFVAKYYPRDSGLTSLAFSTYLGGAGYDAAFGITVDSQGSAYVVGYTGSTNAFSGLPNAGGGDGFLAKLTAAALSSTQLTAAALSSTQIKLTWKDNSTTETGFRVERSLDGVSYVLLPTVVAPGPGSGTTVQFTDTGLTPSTGYCYRVYAISNTDTSLPSDPACTSTLAPTSTVSGKVTLGGQGLSGVTLTLSPVGTTATTGADGAYSFAGLLAGSYTVTPGRTGYVFTPRSSSITVDADRAGVDFSAAKLLSLRGRVTSGGSGLGSVTMTLNPGGLTIDTDLNGAYSFAGLLAGTYTVTPAKSRYVFTPSSRTVDLQADLTGVDFIGSQLFTISGRVTQGGSSGLSGVQVQALIGGSDTRSGSAAPNQVLPDNNPVGVVSSISISGAGAITAARVGVDITHSFRGDLEVSLIHPDGTTVVLHNRTGADAANLVTSYPDQSQPAQSLAVLVGKPIAGEWKLRVRDLVPEDTGRFNGWSLTLTTGDGTIAQTATTGADGAYAITGLPAGPYAVLPVLPAGQVTNPERRSVTVGPDAAGVDFDLASLPQLTGLSVPASIRRSKLAVGTVTVDRSAPAGGVEISLSSSIPSAAQVPDSVTIPQGATSATFNIQAGRVRRATTVSITAQYRGASLQRSLRVK